MEEDESPTTFQLSFVGPSGSGKTTLIERLLPHLAAAGLRVAVVKHTHHRDVRNTQGKDSWRFDRAGAYRVLLVTPELIYFQHRWGVEVTSDPDLLLEGCDLILHEGGRSLPHPKILVGETAAVAAARPEMQGRILAIVGPGDGSAPSFSRNDPARLARFVLRLATGGVPAHGAPALA